MGRRAAPAGAGEAELGAAGVAEDETRPDALLPLAGRSADGDRAIVARLARAPSADRAAALRTLAGAAAARGWKDVVKDVRRALYRFEQRGIAVPPEAPTAPPPTRVLSASPLEGYLSPIDGRGDRLAWLVRTRPGGGLLVMTAIVNEPAGLRDVGVAEMTRKTLRRMSQDMRDRYRLEMVPADGAWVDALLFEGFARARASGGARDTGDYPALRARMTTVDPVALDPPLIARVTRLEPAAETSAHVATLLAQPELATWIVEPPALAPYLAELREAGDSPLVLSPAQQQERVRGVLARAVREVFDAETATAYRRRLEEMAYYFHASKRPDAAAAALASAGAIAHAGTGEGVLLLETIMQRSVAQLSAEATARVREEEAGSLIVKPGAGSVPRGGGPHRPR